MKRIFIVSFALIFFFSVWSFGKIIFSGDRAVDLKEEKEELIQVGLFNQEDLKEKIGQMLLVGFRGTEIEKDSPILDLLKEVRPGGVILFDYDVPSQGRPRNIVSPEQTKKLIQDLQEASAMPLFIAVDAEGGKINRLNERYGFSSFPSHQELGEKDNPEETERIVNSFAEQLSFLGINLNFAPVVDLNANPGNPIIGLLGRSFSSQPLKVVEQARAFIKAHRNHKIISSLKHFPGHGSSEQDSHLGMVDVTRTWKKEELLPYQELIKDGWADMIMTAHVINKNIDPELPATLSSLYIKPILRDEMRFEGVVVSDDMQMGAITKYYGFDEALIAAINAGCNLVIISNNGEKYDEKAAEKARDAILRAVKENRISRQTIDESYERIQTLKEKFGII